LLERASGCDAVMGGEPVVDCRLPMSHALPSEGDEP
jgi:hypothetical protein